MGLRASLRDELIRRFDDRRQVCAGREFRLGEPAREIDDKSVSAYALHGLGDVLTSQADFRAARAAFQSALKLLDAAGEKQTAAETQVALAELAMEEGRVAEVDTPLREAEQEFHNEQQTDDEISAAVALAKAMLAQGKVAEAWAKIDSTAKLAEKIDGVGDVLENLAGDHEVKLAGLRWIEAIEISLERASGVVHHRLRAAGDRDCRQPAAAQAATEQAIPGLESEEARLRELVQAL